MWERVGRDMNFKNKYLCEWVGHDDVACKALREYADSPFKKTLKLMVEIAEKHGVPTEEMKEHWRCIENNQ